MRRSLTDGMTTCTIGLAVGVDLHVSGALIELGSNLIRSIF